MATRTGSNTHQCSLIFDNKSEPVNPYETRCFDEHLFFPGHSQTTVIDVKYTDLVEEDDEEYESLLPDYEIEHDEEEYPYTVYDTVHNQALKSYKEALEWDWLDDSLRELLEKRVEELSEG